MSRKTFMTLASIVAMAVGALAVLSPAALLESKGVVANPAANVWVREVGVALLAIAFMAFRLRTAPDSPALQAFLFGNAALQIGLLPIEIAAWVGGTLTKGSGVVPNSLLHAVLAFAFVYFAVRVKPVRESGPAA
jgi:hypothetical protein